MSTRHPAAALAAAIPAPIVPAPITATDSIDRFTTRSYRCSLHLFGMQKWSLSTGNFPADDFFHDFGGAAINCLHSGVCVSPRYRVFIHEAIPAEQL